MEKEASTRIKYENLGKLNAHIYIWNANKFKSYKY